MNSQKYFLFGLNALFLIIGVSAGVYLVQQNASTASQAASNLEDILFLDTDIISPQVNERFAVTVKAESETKLVSNAQVSLSFDPSLLEIMEVKSGNLFSDISPFTFNYDNSTGTLTYTQESDTSQKIRPAHGSIAIIIFKAKKSGITQLQLNPTTKVSANPSSPHLLQTHPILAIPIRESE